MGSPWPGTCGEHLPELAGDFRVLQFPNGSANLTYLVQIGDRQLVVRRPPFGQLAPGAHDMRREYRTLSRLWQQFDRAPRAFLFCDDHSVVGSDFLVMEYREGEVIWGTIPPSMQSHPEVGRRVGLAVIDALAELHLVEPASPAWGIWAGPTASSSARWRVGRSAGPWPPRPTPSR